MRDEFCAGNHFSCRHQFQVRVYKGPIEDSQRPGRAFPGGKTMNVNNSFILKGHICYTPRPDSLVIRENAYAVCENGICRGVYDRIPEPYGTLEVMYCSGDLIIPGLADLHIHAPQYTFHGTGMDCELMDWLERYAFPEEIRYVDTDYAATAYGIFAEKLRKSATSRAVIFGTVHVPASLILTDCMEKSGLVSYVGKVSMDRNAPPELTEESAEAGAFNERNFIKACITRDCRRTKPILTPRFAPSCTGELMMALGELGEEYDLPVQSHLSENPGEVEAVGKLEPEAAFYGDVYDRYGLFGRGRNTVMAHCIYSTPPEIKRIKANGVWVAHCPSSNMNLASGIAPVRTFLREGIRVGLGTDVAGGSSDSMFRAVTDAIQVSKLYWRYVDQTAEPLSFSEGLYLATKGGGSFFGKAGSFEEGYSFDALVLDDSIEPSPRPLAVRERLERAFYRGLDRTGIVFKAVSGEIIRDLLPVKKS